MERWNEVTDNNAPLGAQLLREAGVKEGDPAWEAMISPKRDIVLLVSPEFPIPMGFDTARLGRLIDRLQELQGLLIAGESNPFDTSEGDVVVVGGGEC